MILSLFLFLGMVLIGGVALDLFRHEHRRAEMQAALDNAVLAATRVDQERDPELVVQDYLARAGYGDLPVEIEVEETKAGPLVTGRSLTASASVPMNTFLMRLADMPSLDVNVLSQATQAINNIEISLVLDVSGSMGNYGRIENLRFAASNFIDEILENSDPERVSISLIPYATQVSAGPDIMEEFSPQDAHPYSHCLEFGANDFNQPSIPRGLGVRQASHFQMGTDRRGYLTVDEPLTDGWTCRIDDDFHIRAFSNSAFELKRQIEGLYAEGSTSIDIGVKWGVALLDPSSRPLIDALIEKGVVDASLGKRPLDYGRNGDTMKLLVVMTDGENMPEYRLEPEFRNGPSDIWRARANGRSYYSVLLEESRSHRGGPRWGRGGRDRDEPYYFWAYNHETSRYSRTDWGTIGENYNPPLDEKQLSWREVWAEMSMAYQAYWLRAQQGADFYDTFYDTYTQVEPGEKDDRLESICAAARRRGITVFTIGFEVDSLRSLNALQDCASSPSHYFDVDGPEIDDAFHTIATSITQLKLTK